jgi:hypothetical protein
VDATQLVDNTDENEAQSDDDHSDQLLNSEDRNLRNSEFLKESWSNIAERGDRTCFVEGIRATS